MARPQSRWPTQLELQILKILWREGPLTVREVRDRLADVENRDLAHTTVVTTLNTMTVKGHLRRTQQGKAYIFAPRVAEKDVSRGMLKDVVERVFDGSAVALMLNLLDSEEITDDEHRELRDLVNRSRKKPGDSS